ELEEISKKEFTKTSLNIDNLTKSLSFILKKYTDTLNAINNNKRQIAKYNEKIGYYNRLLSKIVSQKKIDRRIYITGYAYLKKNFTFKVKYIAYSASWSPSYRLYLSSNKKDIKMEYYAKVSQRTGENWKNVSLILSTSMPNYSLKSPIITSQYLRNIVYRNKYTLGGRKKSAYKSSRPAAMAMDKEESLDASIGVTAAPAIIENAYTVEYRTKAKYSVPSDNSSKNVYLQSQTIKGKTIYTTVPRLDKKVYAQIKSENKGIAPVLPGKVSIYYGQNYIGEYYLKNILPGEKFSMDLGPVNYFKVKFKLLKRKYSPSTLVSAKKKYTLKYEMSISNISGNNYEVIVYDRIPVSQDSKIVVKKIDITPTGYEINKDTGIIKWKLNIKSKNKIKGNISYEVVCPKNYNLNI
ncbi:DUF4139 domain-containing protein, partial [bacterium]|nr:DUF4139 domain-containing protein [bacterium]